jgi:hypothetical protein
MKQKNLTTDRYDSIGRLHTLPTIHQTSTLLLFVYLLHSPHLDRLTSQDMFLFSKPGPSIFLSSKTVHSLSRICLAIC